MKNNIAITPSHLCDPNIAIAACRAGEVGILDLGFGNDTDIMVNFLQSLIKFSGKRGRWGIRWDTLGESDRSPNLLAKFIKETVPILILAGISAEEAAEAAQIGHRFAEMVLLEVCNAEAAQMAGKNGFDGAIVKGNETGGYTGSQSTFVLLQHIHGKMDIPFWVQGGMGLHTAAAAHLAGAAGIVLCEQLWLTEESPIGEEEKKAWKYFDGSETLSFGETDLFFRCYSHMSRRKLRELEKELLKSNSWQESMNRLLLNPEDEPIIPCGQDIGLASNLAEQFHTVGGILTAIRNSVREHLMTAIKQQPFAADAPLAKVHGTRYPFVQGPMANISDVAAFSKSVADAGGLPFVALSALPGPQVDRILKEHHEEMESYNWGVGVLGFLPRALREEQFEVLKKFKPPFAIIAGGRPSQAAEFEKVGISTYIHTPSPGLLSTFVKDGACQFVFEGRECGGHVGPLTSFVLWESVITALLKEKIANPERFRILFAGGIHDGLSAGMVQAIAAPLTALGMHIGLQMGTVYLYCEEAVKHGAITAEYQRQALECNSTVLLQSGVGQACCCIRTPFIDKFYDQKQKLILSGKPDAEVLHELELLNLGRLKIAAKGIECRFEKSPNKDHVKYVLVDQIDVDDETQRCEGLYMIGQVAQLRGQPCSVDELHSGISEQCKTLMDQLETLPNPGESDYPIGEDIAIVGMAGMFPDAADIKEFWHNIMNRRSCIREIPEDRWSVEDFFEPSRQATEKTYSKWGGFLKDVRFDPVKYSMAPKSLESIDAIQQLSLEAAWQALEDAGYHKRAFPRERTSVIFGAGGVNDLGVDYALRAMARNIPKFANDIPEQVRERIVDSLYDNLPEWTTDSFPGILTNLISGRIANRFDLGGANFTCEAACATSMAALEVGLRQLQNHACDVALVGAVDTGNNPFSYLLFSRSQVLSETGESRPLDNAANGIVLGEGVACLVLKRLRDAERDGDQIYAVVKGIGSASDGRKRSLVAPDPDGQIRAMKNAYLATKIDPQSLQLLELHGTGTVLGDKTEFESNLRVFGGNNGHQGKIAIGSVKSNIGHTKCAAGMAGVIKTALSLKHKIFPPTIGVSVPNKNISFEHSPFYISTESRPWFADPENSPRRAGVSGFGFGGTNFHVAMEEYDKEYRDHMKLDLIPRDAEIFDLTSGTQTELEDRLRYLREQLKQTKTIDLSQLAYSVFLDSRTTSGDNACRLMLVASSLEDLKRKLDISLSSISAGKFIYNPLGVYYAEGRPVYESEESKGRICFLFPGQGSQRINMLRDLVLCMPETHGLFEMADQVTAGCFEQPLSHYIYPRPVFSDEGRQKQHESLKQSHVSQPAIGLVSLIAYDILIKYGLKPDFMAGHSFGEYSALCAAGSISREELIRLSEIRGRIVRDCSGENSGTMAAIQADGVLTSSIIEEAGLKVSVANYNAPDQTVIGGLQHDINEAIKVFEAKGLRGKRIPVTAAFHTSGVDEVSKKLSETLKEFEFKSPQCKIFSNTTADLYPQSSSEIQTLLGKHIREPVQFVKQIHRMYSEGVKVFIEAGPGRVLTGLVERILGDAPYSALSLDVAGRPGWVQLAHLLAHSKTLGLSVELTPWFEGRRLKPIRTQEYIKDVQEYENPGPLVWRIQGGRATPYFQAKESRRKERAPSTAKKQQVRSEPSPGRIESPSETTEPVTETTEPVTETTKPVTETLKPVTETLKPVTETLKPVTETLKPLTIEEKRRNAMYKQTPDASIEAKPEVDMQGNTYSNFIFDQCQSSLSHFIAMQHEQQKTAQKFIDIQEKMLDAVIYGKAIVSSENFTIKPVPPAVETAPLNDIKKDDLPIFVTQGVPPTPNLPKLEFDRSKNESFEARPAEIPTPSFEVTLQSPRLVDENKPSPVKKSTSSIPTTEEFKDGLLQIASERTGFPTGMLDLDLNMEADLGIDSIKKVEIFSMLQERYDVMESLDQEELIEELAGLNTLGSIADWYDKKRQEFTSGASAAARNFVTSSELESVA